jgi:hypothetical protein
MVYESHMLSGSRVQFAWRLSHIVYTRTWSGAPHSLEVAPVGCHDSKPNSPYREQKLAPLLSGHPRQWNGLNLNVEHFSPQRFHTSLTT